jgi:hypothetical protein
MKIEIILKKVELNAKRKKSNKYNLIERPLDIAANATITINGGTDFFYIQDEPSNVRVKSKLGVYDTSSVPTVGYGERQAEHLGDLTITNLSASVNKSLTIIQQIFSPRQCKPEAKEDKINIEINQKTIIQ